MQFLTGGKAREPINWLTWLDSKADSKVWMKEDVIDRLFASLLTPENSLRGFFVT